MIRDVASIRRVAVMFIEFGFIEISLFANLANKHAPQSQTMRCFAFHAIFPAAFRMVGILMRFSYRTPPPQH
jgi:hypothetical protein